MIVVHFVSGIKSGGVEQMLYNYTSHLNKSCDIKQYIVYQHTPNISSLTKLEQSGNTCIRIASKTKTPLKNFIDTYKIIKKVNPDVVHCHMNLMNFIPLFIAFLCGTKMRISHSHIAADNINSKLIIKISKKLNLLFANRYLSCGKLAGKYMYGSHKFTVIKNAIQTKDFLFDNSKRKKIREKYNLNRDTLLLGNIGRYTKQKNQIFLIDVFSKINLQIPNSKLLIIGEGEDENKIREAILKYNLETSVELISPKKQIDSYLSAMDLFLLPSLYEGFPVVAVEVQANGLPMIMSNTVDDETKLTPLALSAPLNNIAQWVEVINSVVINKNRANTNIEVFEKYDIENYYKDLWMIYCSKDGKIN